MNLIDKVRKPTSLFLAILFFMVPAFHQTVSAAMVGTEVMLASDHNRDSRGYLSALLSRGDVQSELVVHGIDPDEARARIESLSDEELATIAPILAELPAGGDATGFAVVALIVIVLVACVVEYFSDVKMFPQLFSDDESQ
jgi:hypothetical protein